MISSTPNKVESFFYRKFLKTKIGGLNLSNDRENPIGIVEIEKKYHKATEELKELRRSTIEIICKEAENLGGKFWGIWKTETLEGLAVFTYTKDNTVTGSYSVNWVGQDEIAEVEITSDEDLPPLVEEIKDPEAYQKLRERFDGKCHQLPHRQDLFDLYHTYEHKSRRYNIIRGCCMEVLQRKANKTYYKKRFLNSRTIKLCFGDREYLFLRRLGIDLPGCISEPSNPPLEVHHNMDIGHKNRRNFLTISDGVRCMYDG